MQARTQTAHNCGHSSLLSPRMIWIQPMAGRRGEEEEKMGMGGAVGGGCPLTSLRRTTTPSR